MRPRVITLTLIVLSGALPAAAQTVTEPFWQLQPVVTTGLTHPTSIEFLGPNDFLILEKDNGQVRRVNGGVLNPTPVLDLPVNNWGERGLLGIAIQPNFDATGADDSRNNVYLYYSRSNVVGDSMVLNQWLDNRLSKFDWNGTTLTGESVVATFGSRTDGVTTYYGQHNGGPITFGPDGKLYGIVGDMTRTRSEQNDGTQAALSTSYAGGVFRLNPDGSVPSDNPFTTTQSNTAFHRWFAYGVRNSFGLAFDPVTGKLWDTENGTLDYDEINLVAPGFNSGWWKLMGPDSRNTIRYGDLINLGAASTYSDPEFSWLDSIGVTAIEFLRGSILGSTYDDKVMVGDYNTGQLYLLTLNANRDGFVLGGGLADLVADTIAEQNQLRVGTGFGPTTDITRGPDGSIYVVSYAGGDVYRIVPEPSTFVLAVIGAVPATLLRRRRFGGGIYLRPSSAA